MSAIKSLLESAIVRSGLPQVARRRLRSRTLVLAYHNVVSGSAGDGDKSLHLDETRFHEQLDAIADACQITSLRELAESGTQRDRPRVIITFDDAYRGALVNAVPELRRRGFPATIFVPPAFVPDRTFWWDDAARTGAGLTSALRDQALHEWKGRDADIRSRLSLPLDEAAAELRCASEAELGDASRDGLITLGSHSWSHPNLAALDRETLARELRTSREWLEERYASTAVPWISYPYGLESPAVRQAAREAGYAGGFRVDGGWLLGAPGDPFGLPRLNVPAGLSADGLALRLSGLLT